MQRTALRTCIAAVRRVPVEHNTTTQRTFDQLSVTAVCFTDSSTHPGFIGFGMKTFCSVLLFLKDVLEIPS